MQILKAAAVALTVAFLPLHAAHAEWTETERGGWKGAYACEASRQTCVVMSCQLGQVAQFGIWSKRFHALSASDMREQRRFDISIDGADLSLPVGEGDYVSDKRVIYWPLERQLMADVENGATLSISGWGDPRIDLSNDGGLVARTLKGCSLTDRQSRHPQSVSDRSSVTSDTTSAIWTAAMLEDVMPGGSLCDHNGDEASCKISEHPHSDLNSIHGAFHGQNREIAIRAQIAHSLGDHEGYRRRLYETLAGLRVPQSFVDRCLMRGLTTLDLAATRVECDSYTPENSTVATFTIRQL